jgi:hypothetical protein
MLGATFYYYVERHIAKCHHAECFGAIEKYDLKEVKIKKTCGRYYKSFRIKIYNRNDSTIIEPVL